jgi:putative phosphoesterase
MPPTRPITVGLISDTHGLLRPEAVAALGGSDFIIHAGDIGSPEVLTGLARIAPVTAIRGNVDRGDWAADLPQTEVLQCGGVFIYIVHNLADLDLDPAAAGFQAVVSGHSHSPRSYEKDDILYINPGSAGPRRFSLPIAVAKLTLAKGQVTAEFTELDCRKQ